LAQAILGRGTGNLLVVSPTQPSSFHSFKLTMAPLACNDRSILDGNEFLVPALRNSACLQTHPKGLCGEWKYEYKLPYSPYGNQSIVERYLLLSCGVAYKSAIDKYDEGTDYFSKRRTTGWGRWFVEDNGAIVITCATRTSTLVGGAVCGKERCRDTFDEYYSDSELRESEKHFVQKFTRLKSLDNIDEEKLRAQMLHFLQNLPSKSAKASTEEEEQDDDEEKEMKMIKMADDYKKADVRRQPRSPSQPSQKHGTLNSLRKMFSRNKRQRV